MGLFERLDESAYRYESSPSSRLNAGIVIPHAAKSNKHDSSDKDE